MPVLNMLRKCQRRKKVVNLPFATEGVVYNICSHYSAFLEHRKSNTKTVGIMHNCGMWK